MAADNYKAIVRKISETVLQSQRSKNIIVPKDFLELFVAEVGGPRRLAKNLADIINDPKASSVAKSRVLSDIMHMMAHVSKQRNEDRNLEDITDADLESLVHQIVRERADAANRSEHGQVQGPEAVREDRPGPSAAPAAKERPAAAPRPSQAENSPAAT